MTLKQFKQLEILSRQKPPQPKCDIKLTYLSPINQIKTTFCADPSVVEPITCRITIFYHWTECFKLFKLIKIEINHTACLHIHRNLTGFISVGIKLWMRSSFKIIYQYYFDHFDVTYFISLIKTIQCCHFTFNIIPVI